MPDVVMPRLSDSMEEGTILKWLKAEGDEVARGDELVEIETDKATMTYEADSAGALAIVAQEGDTLPIGEVIARIGAGGEAPAGDGAQAEATQQAEASGNGGPSDAPAAAVPPPPATIAETGTAKGDVSVQELTRTQQVIARRMAESKATVPEFTIATDVDMEGAVELRKQLKAAAESVSGAVPSYNDMVVKA